MEIIVIKEADKPFAMFSTIIWRNLKNTKLRDTLFMIAKLCPSFSVADFMTSSDDFEDMLSAASPLVTEVLT